MFRYFQHRAAFAGEFNDVKFMKIVQNFGMLDIKYDMQVEDLSKLVEP